MLLEQTNKHEEEIAVAELDFSRQKFVRHDSHKLLNLKQVEKTLARQRK